MISRPSLALSCGFAVLLGPAAVGLAQVIPAPEVPEAIRAPAGEHVVLVAHASGSQIYVCAPGADGKAQWTLKGPEAELRDARGSVIGHHTTGPTWKLKDGSAVTGKTLAKSSPDPNSIPWLLLGVVDHDGAGALAHVSSVQRIHTHGGQPPAQVCTPAQRNLETWIPYTADYVFFAPGG